jgi:hypothetical protein
LTNPGGAYNPRRGGRGHKLTAGAAVVMSLVAMSRDKVSPDPCPVPRTKGRAGSSSPANHICNENCEMQNAKCKMQNANSESIRYSGRKRGADGFHQRVAHAVKSARTGHVPIAAYALCPAFPHEVSSGPFNRRGTRGNENRTMKAAERRPSRSGSKADGAWQRTSRRHQSPPPLA